MPAATARVLERFHRVLVAEIRSRRPEYLQAPFTVAEIYQDLVPYRSHRDAIGVEMNGDYEAALLRLLAGEGEYLVLGSDAARREFQQELRSANPNTGLFRQFAAVDVSLNPDRVPSDGGTGNGGSGEAAAPRPSSGARAEPPKEPSPRAPDAGTARPASPAPAGTPAGAPVADGACRACRRSLPERASLRYCPFCGADLSIVPCPHCGEELEPDWKFCVACGRSVTG